MTATRAGQKMAGKNRVVLARDAAANLLPEAACKDERQLWDKQEAEHEAAVTPEAAGAAAAPLLVFCRDCPIGQMCHQWAALDRYTGIAAAQAWAKGQPRPADEIRKPGPKKMAS